MLASLRGMMPMIVEWSARSVGDILDIMNERINGNTCAYHCPPALRD
jgi:hypothetical protein